MNLFCRKISLLVAWTIVVASSFSDSAAAENDISTVNQQRRPPPEAAAAGDRKKCVDEYALRLCGRCKNALLSEKISFGDCCAVAAVQEMCRSATGSDVDDEEAAIFENANKRPSSGKSSSKLFLGKRTKFLLGKRHRNTFLGKRTPDGGDDVDGSGGTIVVDGAAELAGNTMEAAKRPSRNNFLGKRGGGGESGSDVETCPDDYLPRSS